LDAILKSSFGERNFGKPLSETTFGDRLSSCSEQLSTINKFGERFWGTALWSRFGNQLWGAGAALNSS